MIEFTGDWDNLEGNVVIWSRHTQGEEDCIAHTQKEEACTAGEQIYFLHAKSGSSDNMPGLEEITEKLKGRIGDISEVEIIGFDVTSGRAASEQDLPMPQGERLYTGDYSCYRLCLIANKSALDLYSVKFVDQKRKCPKVKEPKLTYESFIDGEERKPILRYIKKTFIDPIVEAQRNEDLKAYASLKKGFFRFASGSLFSQDVTGLFNYLDNHGKESDYEVTGLFARKMNAIHVDDLEDAAEVRDILDVKIT